MSKSIAVAYSMKKKKKASGGSVESGDVTMNLSKGGRVDSKIYNRGDESKQKGVHLTNYKGKGNSTAGSFVKDAKKGSTSIPKEKLLQYAKEEHGRVMSEMKEDKTDRKNLAEGGEVIDGAPAWVCSDCGSHSLTFSGHQDSSHELDMIGKALEKRRMAHGGKTCPPGDVGGSPHYSKGGQVANDEGQGAAADELPNEFDDLVLRDDEEMEGYTGKNSGDEIGGPSKSDVVSKAMLKRKKK